VFVYERLRGSGLAWLTVVALKSAGALVLVCPGLGPEEVGGVGDSDCSDEVAYVGGDRGVSCLDVGARDGNVTAMGEGDGRGEIGRRSGVAGVGGVGEIGLSALGGVWGGVSSWLGRLCSSTHGIWRKDSSAGAVLVTCQCSDSSK
jgi:hypothetical protein